MKTIKLIFLLIFSGFLATVALAQQPIASWSFNDQDFTDQSGNGFDGDPLYMEFNNGVNCDTAAWFDGINSLIMFQDILDTVFVSGTFSISMWAYPEAYVDNEGYGGFLIQKWHTAGVDDNAFILRLSSFNSSNRSVSFSPLELNIWSHIALSVDSGDVEIYVNGVLEASDTGHIFSETNFKLMVGALHNNRYNFKGGIDEVNIYNYALSESQINEEMKQNIFYDQYMKDETFIAGKEYTIGPDRKEGYDYKWNTGATENTIKVNNNTSGSEDVFLLEIITSEDCKVSDTIKVSWLSFYEDLVARWDFNDSIELSADATINNAMVDTGVMCSKSFSFNGVDANISLGDTLNDLFTSGEFSMSIWAYPTDTIDENDYTSMIVSKWHTSGQIDNSFILYIDKLVFADDLVAKSIKFGMPELNKWHQYVIVRKKGVTKVYLDNELVGKCIGGYINSSTYPLMVASHGNNHYNLQGKIDEIKVYDRALTEAFIDQLYVEGSVQKLNALTDLSVDKNSTVTLDAGSGFDTYSWTDGFSLQMNTITNIVSDINNLSVLATNNKGCFSDTVSITINQSSVIDKNEVGSSIKIWPVPMNNVLNLTFSKETPINIQILNSLGKTMLSEDTFESEQSFDVTDLIPGLYIIRFDFDGSIYTKTIVKN